MAVQAALAGEELSSGIAFVMLTQALGPTITLTLFNVLFTTCLKSGILHYVPHADATAIINAGATAFRNIVAPADLDGVLRAYAESLNHVFYRKRHSNPTPLLIQEVSGDVLLQKSRNFAPLHMRETLLELPRPLAKHSARRY